MAEIRVNRAPFLTLWAAVVARRLGYAEEEALTLGRAIAGLTAQSKGRRLGIYEPRPAAEREEVAQGRAELGAERVEFMGRLVPCVRTPSGLRALDEAAPMDPEGVRRYLVGKFGDLLPDVEARLVALASAVPASELGTRAMDLYVRVRPDVPKGEAGWGKAGLLDLEGISRLAAELGGQEGRSV